MTGALGRVSQYRWGNRISVVPFPSGCERKQKEKQIEGVPRYHSKHLKGEAEATIAVMQVIPM